MLGMAYPAINDSNLFKGLVPLPPLAEQKRIVEKCDRLLILCDEIEKRQRQRQESLLKMNEGAISQLLATQNPTDFQHHWQRICNNFDLLYSIPETIPKLRQAILQLAVQGKLVSQNSDDEPASSLLGRIKIKGQELLDQRVFRKHRNLKRIHQNETYFEIPSNWCWARLGEFGEFLGGGTPSKANSSFWEGDIPWISPKDMKVSHISDSLDHI
jgi:type I restriction enzyme S subunit